ncbi:twin-arginine translocase TatA/TatE family subunit [Helicobacter canis]|uniref:Sec-independent protein translocase protein TatA n=1 Tax=Helicobacter canis TaxID=29419 RepID=A0A5M9QGI7_9HELI|nr:twin-arginine translocase TatA/TatE family subunit [Helicobacter canis]KAA8707250.1 twin-arginine translocase TatA/TatE family subunit [Helicobacter canis]
MGSFSWWHWLIVLLVVLLLFGGGKKIPELLKGLGTGIKGFKKAVRDDEEESLDSSSSPATPLASPAPKQASLEQAQQPQVVRVEVSTTPKKRGRPKGSANKTESSKSTDSKKSAQSKAKKSSTKDSKATKATKSSKSAK